MYEWLDIAKNFDWKLICRVPRHFRKKTDQYGVFHPFFMHESGYVISMVFFLEIKGMYLWSRLLAWETKQPLAFLGRYMYPWNQYNHGCSCDIQQIVNVANNWCMPLIRPMGCKCWAFLQHVYSSMLLMVLFCLNKLYFIFIHYKYVLKIIFYL